MGLGKPIDLGEPNGYGFRIKLRRPIGESPYWCEDPHLHTGLAYPCWINFPIGRAIPSILISRRGPNGPSRLSFPIGSYYAGGVGFPDWLVRLFGWAGLPYRVGYCLLGWIILVRRVIPLGRIILLWDLSYPYWLPHWSMNYPIESDYTPYITPL